MVFNKGAPWAHYGRIRAGRRRRAAPRTGVPARKSHDGIIMNYIVFEPGEPEPMPLNGVLRVTFAVGRYHCTMTKDLSANMPGATSVLNAQWEPDVPGRLNKAELAQYRAGRNGFYQRAANIIRGRTMV